MLENELLQQLSNGNSDAYRPIVERYQTGLIIHCENLIKDRHAAEDIAQESFIKAYTMIATFDAEKGKFSTWLYKIATNKCLDELRKHKRMRPLENIEVIAETATSLLYDDQIDHIRRAVDELQPPEYSQVIKAYYWEGKSYQAIAEELNIPSKTIGTWIYRAKRQLKAQLKEVLA